MCYKLNQTPPCQRESLSQQEGCPRPRELHRWSRRRLRPKRHHPSRARQTQSTRRCIHPRDTSHHSRPPTHQKAVASVATAVCAAAGAAAAAAAAAELVELVETHAKGDSLDQGSKKQSLLHRRKGQPCTNLSLHQMLLLLSKTCSAQQQPTSDLFWQCKLVLANFTKKLMEFSGMFQQGLSLFPPQLEEDVLKSLGPGA